MSENILTVLHSRHSATLRTSPTSTLCHDMWVTG